MLTRRNFLKTGLTTGAAALPLASVLDRAQQPAEHAADTAPTAQEYELVAMPARLPQADLAAEPWQQRVRRVGQTNMTEHDPAVMNVEEWADYWHASKVDVVYVSVTGILAFYPSKVPFHKHGKFLNDRDFFGECTAAAKKRGMRVVARMSPDLNWPDALAAHPEWAMRHKDGSPQLSTEDPRLFKTCMFSTYMDDYVPADHARDQFALRYRLLLHKWLAASGAIAGLLLRHLLEAARRAERRPTGASLPSACSTLWKRYDAIAKEKKPESFFFANSGGNVRGSAEPRSTRQDHLLVPGRQPGADVHESAVWGCSSQGRVCNAVLDGKFAANVTGLM